MNVSICIQQVAWVDSLLNSAGCSMWCATCCHQIRNVGLCLCRPVKNKDLFYLFILEFKLELELGLGLKLE